MVEFLQVKQDVAEGEIMKVGIRVFCFSVNQKDVSRGNPPAGTRQNMSSGPAVYEHEFRAFMAVQGELRLGIPPQKDKRELFFPEEIRVCQVKIRHSALFG